DPYEEATQQLFEQAPHSLEYVPRDHVPVFVPEFKHPEDLVPAEEEAPVSLLPPGFLSPRTPPLLPIPLSTPSTSRKAGIPEADTPPRNRPLLDTPRPGCEVEESFAAVARRPGPTMAHGVDCSYVETRLRDTEKRMMAALELVNLRVSYQEPHAFGDLKVSFWHIADDFPFEHGLAAGIEVSTCLIEGLGGFTCSVG
nr:hypothetical protein [Tanacetum cinerariifolium]